MCNLYAPPTPQQIADRFGVRPPAGDYGPTVAPLKPGPIVLAGQALVAQWGMIPPWSRSRVPTLPNGGRMSTNNARRERMATAPTFRDAWRKGQRCIIPALTYDEPYWGTGKNIWWRFAQADGQPWALAGLWSEWTDPESGELVPNYTLITQNCDGHPVLGLMHKPDPKLPPDQQDKRCPVPLAVEDWDAWLNGTPDQAASLIKVPPVELLQHGPADPAVKVSLPLF